MLVHLTAAQAQAIARLAEQAGGRVALHQIAEGDDVFVSHAGALSEMRVDRDGRATAVARRASADAPGFVPG